MALDRWKLRDDLVAMIAAGRELSPEHDHALADVFLDHAHESLLPDRTPPPAPGTQSHLGAWIGTGCLAVAALLSPFLLGHASHHGDEFSQPVVAHAHAYGPPIQNDRPNWWYSDQGSPSTP